MFCLILSGAFCFAHSEEGKLGKGDEITIDLIEVSSYTEPSKGDFISSSINGHVLTAVFNGNLGQITVEIATSTGVSVQCLSVLTPNGLQFYIPSTGDYLVTFTLSNGNVYGGEFTVTD